MHLRGEDDEKMSGEELEKLRDHADEKKVKYNKAISNPTTFLVLYQLSWMIPK